MSSIRLLLITPPPAPSPLQISSDDNNTATNTDYNSNSNSMLSTTADVISRHFPWFTPIPTTGDNTTSNLTKPSSNSNTGTNSTTSITSNNNSDNTNTSSEVSLLHIQLLSLQSDLIKQQSQYRQQQIQYNTQLSTQKAEYENKCILYQQQIESIINETTQLKVKYDNDIQLLATSQASDNNNSSNTHNSNSEVERLNAIIAGECLIYVCTANYVYYILYVYTLFTRATIYNILTHILHCTICTIYYITIEKDEELEEFDEVYTQLTTQVETLEQHILTLETTYNNDSQIWMAEKEALLKSGGSRGDRGKDKPVPEPEQVQIQSLVHSAQQEEILALQHTIATLESNIAILANKSNNDEAELTMLREHKDKYSNMSRGDQGVDDGVAVEVDKASSHELVELKESLALKEEKLVSTYLTHVIDTFLTCPSPFYIYMLRAS